MRLPVVCLLVGLLALGCRPFRSSSSSSASPDTIRVHEVTPRPLPLGPPLDRADMEISGLTWYGDTLVVLPQYPSRAAPAGTRRLYGLSRAALERVVSDSTAAPLVPISIPLTAADLGTHAPTYDGFEAIAFAGPRVYLALEGDRDEEGTQGFLLRGTAAPGLRDIHVETSAVRPLPVQATLRNMSYEALTARDDTVLALFEANGVRVNPAPQVHRYDAMLQSVGPVPFPTLEYRLTDATSLDADSRFWVMNYFFPGERGLLRPGTDSLAARFGQGRTHRASAIIERVVEYRYTPTGIRRTGTPPLWFTLADGTGRNWEGLARFGDGFLVATDRFPSTILAYVPLSR